MDKIIAVLLSGGTGKRLGSVQPKQFLELNNKQIIQYSLDKFQACSAIDSIIIVSHADYIEEINTIAKQYGKFIKTVEGGKRRQDSVLNGVKWIQENTECNYLLIHDSARPLFSETLLNKLIDTVKEKKAVIPVLPLLDTIKIVKDNKVMSTPDRNTLYRVQTPQVFSFDLIERCYEIFPFEYDITDDASILEYCSVSVSTVDGEYQNIKITYMEDIKIAEAFI